MAGKIPVINLFALPYPTPQAVAKKNRDSSLHYTLMLSSLLLLLS
jgi:hypothetical protein